MSLILDDFISANPPDLMASAISESLARATSCHVGKEETRLVYARSEFISEVFWDSIVRINSEIGECCGFSDKGP